MVDKGKKVKGKCEVGMRKWEGFKFGFLRRKAHGAGRKGGEQIGIRGQKKVSGVTNGRRKEFKTGGNKAVEGSKLKTYNGFLPTENLRPYTFYHIPCAMRLSSCALFYQP